jgi:hypothetical protein
MEATKRQNYHYYILLGYTPPKDTLGILFVAPSDGFPATAPRLASTQALLSRRVSSASKSLGAHVGVLDRQPTKGSTRGR